MTGINQATLKALRRGDEDAYAEVIYRLFQPVYRFAYRLSRNSAVAEDITQETFIVVWQQIGSFKGKSRFSTWVFGIAYKQYLRICSKRTVPIIEIEQNAYENLDDPCEQMQQTELQIQVREALESLPDIYRHVVFLVYIQGLTHREAAQVLDVPIGTIKSRMSQ